MGRLSGFRYRQIIKKLKAFGFEFFRNAAGSHEIWYHPGDMPEGILRAILKQAGIEPDDFLKKQIVPC